MIDLRFLRENPDVVKENIKKKFQDHKLPLVDEVIELDAQARKTQQEADEIRANRNKLSKFFLCHGWKKINFRKHHFFRI